MAPSITFKSVSGSSVYDGTRGVGVHCGRLRFRRSGGMARTRPVQQRFPIPCRLLPRFVRRWLRSRRISIFGLHLRVSGRGCVLRGSSFDGIDPSRSRPLGRPPLRPTGRVGLDGRACGAPRWSGAVVAAVGFARLGGHPPLRLVRSPLQQPDERSVYAPES